MQLECFATRLSRALRAAHRKVIALLGRGAVLTMRMPIQRGVS
jgi:hypothetical protein